MHTVNEEFRSSFFDPRRHSLLNFIIWGEMSPLEIPLEVRKEMEIAWRQVRAVGRMGENLKLQCLQSINRCASSVQSCIVMQQQNRRCWPPNSTHPPLYVFYGFNVLSWIDSIPSFQKFCHVNSLWVPKTVKESFRQTALFLIFSGEEMKCANIACSVVFRQGQNDESMTHAQ